MSDEVMARIITAVAPAAPGGEAVGKIDAIESKGSNVEPPFNKYKEINGRPYSADYFGLNHMWDNLTKELDVSDMRGKIDVIEKYVHDEIQDRRMEDQVSSYNSVIGNIKSMLKLESNMKPDKSEIFQGESTVLRKLTGEATGKLNGMQEYRHTKYH